MILMFPNSFQKTASGIFLPSSAVKDPLPEATVIAVGPGAPNKQGAVVPTSVKAGDRVILPGWGGSSFKVGEEVSHHEQCHREISWTVELTWDLRACRSTSSTGIPRFLPRFKSRFTRPSYGGLGRYQKFASYYELISSHRCPLSHAASAHIALFLYIHIPAPEYNNHAVKFALPSLVSLHRTVSIRNGAAALVSVCPLFPCSK